MDNKKSRIFLDPLIKANPLFVMILGTCPAIAVTTSLENALGMGILFTFVLVCSNVIISALRKLIPDEVRTPAYIVIIATFVTVVKILTETFVPALSESLGVFIPLLVVNCIVLGRAEAFASKNNVVDSLIDGLGNGVGYTFAISVVALIREVFGTGTITFGKVFTFLGGEYTLPILSGYPGSEFSMKMEVLTSPAGGFLVLGIVLAIITAITNEKKRRDKEKAKAAEKAAKAAAVAKATAAQPAPAVTPAAPAAEVKGGN